MPCGQGRKKITCSEFTIGEELQTAIIVIHLLVGGQGAAARVQWCSTVRGTITFLSLPRRREGLVVVVVVYDV